MRRVVWGYHSERDERCIDKLQAAATEHVGRGAAILVDREERRVIVFDARGDEQLVVAGRTKEATIARAIAKLRRAGRAGVGSDTAGTSHES